MKKCLKHFFKSFDIFKVNIGFNIKDKEAYTTCFGGIIFLIYIIVALYFIISNSFAFITRSKFNQNTIEYRSDYAPELNVLNPQMALAFGITFDGAVDLSHSNYFQLVLNKVVKIKNNNTKTKTPIKLINCTKDCFNNAINDTFDLFHLDTFYCIDRDYYNSSLIIQGLFTEDIFSYLEYSIVMGKEAYTDLATFKEFFKTHEISLQLYYLDSTIKLSDYSSPLKSYLNSKYIQLSFPFVFKSNFDFSNQTFENDDNIMTTDIKSTSFSSPSFYEPMSYFLGTSRIEEKLNDYSLFARFFIRSSQESIITRRVYQKFGEYFADSTSVISQILLVLMILVSAYNKVKAKETIIDRIIRYKPKIISKYPKDFNYFRQVFNAKKQNAVVFFTGIDNNVDVKPHINRNYNQNIIMNQISFAGNGIGVSNCNCNINGSGVLFQEKDSEIKLSNQNVNINNNMHNNSNLNYSGSNININDNNVNININTGANNNNNDYHSNNNNNYKKRNNKRLQLMTMNINGSTQAHAQAQIHYNHQPKSMIVLPKSSMNQFLFKYYNKEKTSNKQIAPHRKKTSSSSAKLSTLKFNFCDNIKYLLLKLGIKSQIVYKKHYYDKGLKHYMFNLNILTYFRKMREMDLLKHLLFNQSELQLIRFLSSPSVSYGLSEKDSVAVSAFNQFEMKKEHINNLAVAYEEVNEQMRERDCRTGMIDKLVNQASIEIYKLIK